MNSKSWVNSNLWINIGTIWNNHRREISLLAEFAFLYQLIIVPRVALFGNTGGLPGILIGIGLMILGYLVGGLLTKKSKRFLNVLLSYTTSIFAAVLIAIIHWKFTPWLKYDSIKHTRIFNYFDWSFIQRLMITFEAIAAFILYFAGVRIKLIKYNLILSRKKLIFGAITFATSIIFIQYYMQYSVNSDYLKDPALQESFLSLKRTVYTFVYTFIALSLIIKNQQNLDNAFVKKHIDISTVPKNIRNYNTLIITIIFALIIMIFNIKTLVRFIVNIISNTPRAIIIFFFKMLELFSKLLPAGQEGGSQQGGQPDLSGLPQTDANPIAALITKIVFGIIIVAAGLFLISKLPAFFRAMGRKFNDLISRIGGILSKFFHVQKEELNSEVDYVDETTIIKPISKDNRKNDKESEKKIRRMGGSSWKNADYTQKIRFMYSVVVNYIKKSGMDIERSDTTGEIYIKSLKTCDQEVDGSEFRQLEKSLGIVTLIYDKIRYGHKIPDSDEYTMFEENFSHTAEILKKK